MVVDVPRHRSLVLVTGLSGAGRSTALKALEDEGFEAIDNLPLSMLGDLLDHNVVSPAPLAVAVDVRSRQFDAELFLRQIADLRTRKDLRLSVVFLESDADVLLRRFTETRRRHPLAANRSVAEGIALERDLMEPIRAVADLVVDTTALSGGDLRRHVVAHLEPGKRRALAVFIISFSYRQGVPRNADLVFDVRFLDNPHYVDALRPQTGRDAAVAAHIEKDPSFAPFMERLTALLDVLLPGYEREGKHYLTIAIGCTGGRHRSVFVAERLAALLSDARRRVSLQHRDLAP